MKTIVYVDGFNLYYRALRGTRFKWLDLGRLVQKLLPSDQIVRIHYYTARITSRPGDLDQPIRQQIYLRALATLPSVQVTFGQFSMHARRYPLAANPSQKVEVLRTDEKGSDVNLAAHLVYEGMRGDYEAAAVVSNDSDLAEPIRLMAKEVGKPVGVLSPSRIPSRELLQVATFFKQIRPSALAACQFPDTLTDAHGAFRKPATW